MGAAYNAGYQNFATSFHMDSMRPMKVFPWPLGEDVQRQSTDSVEEASSLQQNVR